MKVGKQTMDKVQQQMNIDEMEDIKDDIAEQLEKQDEIGNFFADEANKDKDDLADELEEMLAEEEMDSLAVGGDAIAAQAQPA
mmetsp:Transcript_34264/g.52530  ORF Transcript_34264/g.52530 Transcript_34264/m.52530 type:complete len:83 (+) Transcript_34264:336-584(+)|eukprot:CAMPEP_0170479280 /NCGR_PEP_ID=MMETSP0208-20121228/573_1 /TAXON_ID=197538 /ORGANISM="Strombidium inclinatum, Strain S3" /LENGTH=82 /DNA_ID=CAMNT_0010751645 /DNA_START=336 /DNA_END=584 /DNA_ORIENTATION=+